MFLVLKERDILYHAGARLRSRDRKIRRQNFSNSSLDASEHVRQRQKLVLRSRIVVCVDLRCQGANPEQVCCNIRLQLCFAGSRDILITLYDARAA